MDIDQAERLGIDRLQQYQAAIVALNREITEMAAEGKYEAAGRAFAKLLRLQAEFGLLPDAEAYSVLLGQLDGWPSKVLGIR